MLRSSGRPSRALCLVSALVTLSATPSAAHARGVAEQCVESHFQGQVAQKRGSLLEAGQLFAECAAASCPEIVRVDCTALLAEVQAATPTVVFSALDESGRDLTKAWVRVNQKSAPVPVDGRAIQLNPGRHAIAVEAEGYFGKTAHIVLREGEKRRPVVVHLTPVEPGQDRQKDARGIHPLAYVFGGLGLAATGSWAYFGLTGLSKRADCNDGEPCAAEVNTHLLIADVSLLVSLASLGTGSYFLFARPGLDNEPERRSNASRSVRLTSQVGPSSARVSVSADF